MTETFAPLLVDAAGAARLLGIGKSLFYQMASTGRLGPMPVEFHSKKLWSVEEIQDWIRAQCPCRDEWLEILESRKNAN